MQATGLEVMVPGVALPADTCIVMAVVGRTHRVAAELSAASLVWVAPSRMRRPWRTSRPGKGRNRLPLSMGPLL